MKRTFKYLFPFILPFLLASTCDKEDKTNANDDAITVYGVVSCDGTGIGGVYVTDGYEMVCTAPDGSYRLKSDKKDGFVYITVPSGYEVACDGTRALFYDYLTHGADVPERHDFALAKADQTNHTAIFLGDMHLAGGKKNDREQFASVTSELNAYVSSHPDSRIYAFTLGDMTWDCYWYSRNYGFEDYLDDINVVTGLPVFNTIGNHDHNMRTSVDGSVEGWASVDWDTAGEFRKDLGPNYYSVNIGEVHYIVVDNIFCRNTTGGEGSDRHYTEKVSDDNLRWLEKDLAHVDSKTPIVVTMHASLFSQTGIPTLDNAADLKNIFSGFKNVTFITGHTHKMWTVSSSNIKEHNSGAVCGAWWWAGYFNPTLNLAQDGAPSGYRIMDVHGNQLTSYFKGTLRPENYQFRSYDLNETYIPETVVGNISDYGSYGKKRHSNEVLINVWDYNPEWKVEVIENGKSLEVRRETQYDPLYILAYVANRYGAKKSNVGFAPFKTSHMFIVKASTASSTLEIRVTDDEGRTYFETMVRPKPFTIDTYR